MSSISDQFDKEIDVLRLGDDSGNTESYGIHLSNVPCTIQPLDESYSEDVDGSMGKDSIMFCEVCDIKESDRIEDGTDTYRVVGLETFHFLGEDQHMELRIRLFNP